MLLSVREINQSKPIRALISILHGHWAPLSPFSWAMVSTACPASNQGDDFHRSQSTSHCLLPMRAMASNMEGSSIASNKPMQGLASNTKGSSIARNKPMQVMPSNMEGSSIAHNKPTQATATITRKQSGQWLRSLGTNTGNGFDRPQQTKLFKRIIWFKVGISG